jgi:hypothetical protein
MKHRQQTVAEKGWDGEFGTNGRDLDRSPRIGAPRSLMLKVGVHYAARFRSGPKR